MTDSKNCRIQVFTEEGKFKLEFGHYQLDWPCGIAVDTKGLIYVGDGGDRKCVSIFCDGKYITSFVKFLCPRGLTVDNMHAYIYI